ncbi:glucosaminidase domain-containing protein [Borreliella bissettiae]|uniref:Glucosaminidase n=2 Tax=Borrelia bissettiae TaxID=64897 RepID=A0A1L8ZBM7_BORBI|nr:glucosaminidase domain-containing protein [Borreliella bissettiae]AEL18698.1 N-acetylmuramoyl-L-alanine amidase [Borreliella bissettiae DN127]MCD2401328.1 glucosaminidase domain-containing protein [Borreliella bissettiae]OJH15132.1 glucosaminidase [Borreliella bissettiae]WKC99942.1 glucosaminidase domain-containing protein [Borreliella bissettiae]WNY60299.1 glucosaminidase domain-containing protein [Borreliella bissettiae]
MIKKFLLFAMLSIFLANKAHSNEEVIEISTEIQTEKYIPFLISRGKTQLEDLVKYTLEMNPDLDKNYVNTVAKTYIDESLIEGVNYDIAYAQMLLETGALKFNGIVSKEQHNFSGIGATNNLTKGNSFSNITEGIKAHIQHLKAYASKQNIKSNMVDPRFYLVKRGSAPTIYDLTGKWAKDQFYDKKLKKILLELLEYNNANKS